jgi:hypothetical protein
MSIKKAQKIVNEVDHELGISLVAYQNNDLEFLKKKLEDFLELEIETEELQDADDAMMGEEFEEDESQDLED